jgi:NADH:ubiquinone oxidoreductase subunit K
VIQPLDLMLLSAALFAVGVYGMLARRNAILVLISIELMLNAVTLNLIAASLVPEAQAVAGQAIALLIIGVGAAEVGVCLAITLALYRRHRTVNVDSVDFLKW